jgi:hypothetical protein
MYLLAEAGALDFFTMPCAIFDGGQMGEGCVKEELRSREKESTFRAALENKHHAESIICRTDNDWMVQSYYYSAGRICGGLKAKQ